MGRERPCSRKFGWICKSWEWDYHNERGQQASKVNTHYYYSLSNFCEIPISRKKVMVTTWWAWWFVHRFFDTAFNIWCLLFCIYELSCLRARHRGLQWSVKPGTQQAEAGGSGAKSQCWPSSEFEAALGYIGSYVKTRRPSHSGLSSNKQNMHNWCMITSD